MNKELEIIKGLFSDNDADNVQAVTQIISGIPRDIRLIFAGEAMAMARMQGVNVPPLSSATLPPTHPRKEATA